MTTDARARNDQDWWSELRHQGVLIAPALLQESFPEPASVEPVALEDLRQAYIEFESWWETDPVGPEPRKGPVAPLMKWLDAVLLRFLGHHELRWRRGNQIPEALTAVGPAGEKLRPNRVLYSDKLCTHPALLLKVDRSLRVGRGRGRQAFARLVELLRRTGVNLGLLTNGRGFRLVYAGLDHSAWVEWDAESWFVGGESGEQLAGLATLLGPRAIAEVRPGRSRLLEAVERSRAKQGELSTVLSEQVRRAVEVLLSALDRAARQDPSVLADFRTKPGNGQPAAEEELLPALYQAGIRIIMRLVVLLYAEARGLLPGRTELHELYDSSYGLQGLYEELEQAALHAGPQALEEQRGAWPRLLGLFRLIHEGSTHEALPIQAYGGELFRRGERGALDPVIRALAAFENPALSISDEAVLSALRLLKIGKTKVRQGRSSTWVAGPVDFSDLSSHYIGIMYEGLLDYELKQPPEPHVLLDIGPQPLLPLKLLEDLSDKGLRELFEKFGKEDAGPGEEPDEAPFERTEGAEEAEEGEALGPRAALFGRALAWAERAVEVTRLVKPRGGRNADPTRFARERETRARKLLKRVVAGGETVLVRWGGTRKGSGTFHTVSELTVPMVQETLWSLCYESDRHNPVPKKPAAILDLKVCDPAMGSGSFLVAALRFLTEALKRSLIHHEHIEARSRDTVLTLPLGERGTGELNEDVLPVTPDDESFDERLSSRLKRYVVERCIYGVDINPLAVEFAKAALWIETLDPELPFEFLDHKLRCGNSLVGCWLERFTEYPALAWKREGGDGKQGKATKKLKEIFQKRIKTEMRDLIRGQQNLPFQEPKRSALELVAEAREKLERLEQIRPHEVERRERYYREEVQDSESREQLIRAFDLWCALWFWPIHGDEDLQARLPTPATFAREDPELQTRAAEIARQMRFFHWELAFPDVFSPERRGFDAVIANPPWDILKPNSNEFFARYDPIYRTRGKQEALKEQKRIFASHPEVETEWIDYQGSFKAMSNWVKFVGSPCWFVDKNALWDQARRRSAHMNSPLDYEERKPSKDERLWDERASKQRGLCQPRPPFIWQGGADLNAFKLFTELIHHLTRDGGRMGFLVPSGLYSDQGCAPMRRLFLQRCSWRSLLAMVNERFIFPAVHHSFRFVAAIVERGGETEQLEARYRLTVQDAPRAEELPELIANRDREAILLDPPTICRFSPRSLTFLTFRNQQDREICEKIYAGRSTVREFEQANEAGFRRELDVTNDSKILIKRKKLEKQGILGGEDDARDPLVRARLFNEGYLPVWEGKQCFFASWIADQALFVKRENVGAYTSGELPVGIRRIARSTDSRTLVCCLPPPGCPTTYTIQVCRGLPVELALRTYACLSSFIIDFCLRLTVGGSVSLDSVRSLPDLVGVSLTIPSTIVEGLHSQNPEVALWSRISFDALLAKHLEISQQELEHILESFPAVDQSLPREHRLTTLVGRAFELLEEDEEATYQDLVKHCALERIPHDQAGVYSWVPDLGWNVSIERAKSMIAQRQWASFFGRSTESRLLGNNADSRERSAVHSSRQDN